MLTVFKRDFVIVADVTAARVPIGPDLPKTPGNTPERHFDHNSCRSEILCNACISLLGDDGRVLDPSIPPG